MVTLEKVALIRDSSVPIGQPAPMRLNCPCGNGAEVTGSDNVECSCGRTYTARGWLVVPMCFAVPGHTIIDEINPETGRSRIYGKTLDDIRVEYPDAQVMSIDAYCESKAAAQDTPIVWIETTQEQYDEMLNVLPPIDWNPAVGFLVGEPYDHHATSGRPRFTACIHRTTHGEGWKETRYFQSSRPMTRAEFAAIK